MRKAVRKQLGYLGRNLKMIDKLMKITSLLWLGKRMYKLLLVINEVYRQQKWMYGQRACLIDDRIVSSYQLHVRPIKLGKAGAGTEFGAKISVSAIDGYCFLDCLSWDAYNESGDLIEQAKAYRTRFGNYPASIHADTIYRTRNNIKYCTKHGIRLSGVSGCLKKNVSVNSTTPNHQARWSCLGRYSEGVICGRLVHRWSTVVG
jgi:hypothetical protein